MKKEFNYDASIKKENTNGWKDKAGPIQNRNI